MYTKKGLLLTAIFIIISAVISATAEAGILVSPDRHIVQLSPGESRTVEYKIFNEGPQDLQINIEPENWTDSAIDIYTWLSLEDYNIEVKKGETKTFRVNVTPPQGLKGEIVAMLFLCYKEDKDSPLNIRNGIPLYLVMEGTENYSMQIADISAGYIEEGVPASGLKIMVKVINSGNMHVKPDVKVLLKDKNGELLKDFLLEKTNIILRGRDNAHSFYWRGKSLPDGEYRLEVKASYEDKVKEAESSAAFSVVNRELIMDRGNIKEQ